jgi:hypothetical protein
MANLILPNTLLFLFKYPTPSTDHQPFSQLGEVIGETRPVLDEAILAILVDVDGGNGSCVIYVLDLCKEGGEASYKVGHSFVLAAAGWGDRHLDNWP